MSCIHTSNRCVEKKDDGSRRVNDIILSFKFNETTGYQNHNEWLQNIGSENQTQPLDFPFKKCAYGINEGRTINEYVYFEQLQRKIVIMRKESEEKDEQQKKQDALLKKYLGENINMKNDLKTANGRLEINEKKYEYLKEKLTITLDKLSERQKLLDETSQESLNLQMIADKTKDHSTIKVESIQEKFKTFQYDSQLKMERHKQNEELKAINVKHDYECLLNSFELELNKYKHFNAVVLKLIKLNDNIMDKRQNGFCNLHNDLQSENESLWIENRKFKETNTELLKGLMRLKDNALQFFDRRSNYLKQLESNCPTVIIKKENTDEEMLKLNQKILLLENENEKMKAKYQIEISEKNNKISMFHYDINKLETYEKLLVSKDLEIFNLNESLRKEQETKKSLALKESNTMEVKFDKLLLKYNNLKKTNLNSINSTKVNIQTDEPQTSVSLNQVKKISQDFDNKYHKLQTKYVKLKEHCRTIRSKLKRYTTVDVQPIKKMKCNNETQTEEIMQVLDTKGNNNTSKTIVKTEQYCNDCVSNKNKVKVSNEKIVKLKTTEKESIMEKQKLVQNENILEEKILELRKIITDKTEDHEKISKKLEEIKANEKEAKEKLVKINLSTEIKSTRYELSNESSLIEQRNKDLRIELREKSIILENIESENTSLTTENTKLKNKLVNLEELITSMKDQLKEVEELQIHVKMLREEKESLGSENMSLQQESEEFNKKLNELTKENSNLTKSLLQPNKKLAEEIEKCSKHEKELKESTDANKELNLLIGKHEDTIKENKTRISKLVDELKALENSTNTADDYDKIQGDFKELQQKFDEVYKEKNSLEQEFEVKLSVYKKKEKDDGKRVSELENEIKSLENNTTNAEDYNRLQDNFKVLEKELQEVLEEKNSLEKEFKIKLKKKENDDGIRISELENEIKCLENNTNNAEDYKRLQDNFKILEKELQGVLEEKNSLEQEFEIKLSVYEEKEKDDEKRISELEDKEKVDENKLYKIEIKLSNLEDDKSSMKNKQNQLENIILKHQKESDSLKQQIERLNDDLTARDDEFMDERQQCTEYKKAIYDLKEKIEEYENDIDVKDTVIEQLTETKLTVKSSENNDELIQHYEGEIARLSATVEETKAIKEELEGILDKETCLLSDKLQHSEVRIQRLNQSLTKAEQENVELKGKLMFLESQQTITKPTERKIMGSCISKILPQCNLNDSPSNGSDLQKYFVGGEESRRDWGGADECISVEDTTSRTSEAIEDPFRAQLHAPQSMNKYSKQQNNVIGTQGNLFHSEWNYQNKNTILSNHQQNNFKHTGLTALKKVNFKEDAKQNEADSTLRPVHSPGYAAGMALLKQPPLQPGFSVSTNQTSKEPFIPTMAGLTNQLMQGQNNTLPPSRRLEPIGQNRNGKQNWMQCSRHLQRSKTQFKKWWMWHVGGAMRM